MVKRVFAVASVVSVLVIAGSALGANAAPGPNGHNNKGLCNAYHSGSENGIAHKRKAPPFVQLAADVAGGQTVYSPGCEPAGGGEEGGGGE